MDNAESLWPEDNRSFWEIKYPEYEIRMNWTKNTFEDYKRLAYNYANCGYVLFENIIESGRDNVKSDMWFLSTIYLMRQSLELGLKALYCRTQKYKPKVQEIFLGCKHNLSLLLDEYLLMDENYLLSEEKIWIKSYLDSLENVDKKSDMFRFPFNDDFLSQFRDKFLDNASVANNMVQAFFLIKKCLNCGIVYCGEEFDATLEPSFFIFDSHGFGNCYLWQPISDDGFYTKVEGYKNTAKYLFYECDKICLENKIFPLLFLLRNSLELCLKRIFYSRVEKGVSEKIFRTKRNSHYLMKDLWKNVRPVLENYSNDYSSDDDIINIVEKYLLEIDNMDKAGDVFRYPTSYSLEYRFNSKNIDVKNAFEIMYSIINFLDGCDAMLNNIYDYEAEMYSYGW